MRGRLLKGTGLAVAAAILSLTGAATATSMNTYVAMAEESSDFEIDENGVLKRYTGQGGNVVIPDGVTRIENMAFFNCSSLTGIIIPKSVSEIGIRAFFECTGLESIIVDEENTVYNSANGCNVIIKTETGAIILGCNNSIIPEGVTGIENYAFVGCDNLSTIYVPKSVKWIGFFDFDYLMGYITLPAFKPGVVKEIYYGGSEEDWKNVGVYDDFTKVKFHYNYNPNSIEETVSSVFTDVPDGKWYSKEILYVYKRGAMKGKSEGVFDPLSLIQRSETIAMLYQLEGSPAVDTSKSLFPDVTSKNWYNNAATWGKTNGIISGLSSGPDAGKFMPKNQITRQDFTKILYEYAKYKGYDVSVKSATSYTEVEDASLISKYARECMNWGYENKFIANGSNFKPKDNITRREAAVMLARFLEKYDYK